MRDQNYDDSGHGWWHRLRGYHPPACTCYQCNEGRLAQEATDEEERQSAEYERRVGGVRARQETPDENDVETDNKDQNPDQERAGSEPGPPSRPSRSSQPNLGYGRLTYRTPAANPPRDPQSPPPEAQRQESPSGAQPGKPSQPYIPPSSRNPAPVADGTQLPGRRKKTVVILWMAFLAVGAGLVAVILYGANPGLLSLAQENNPPPVALVAPEPTREPTPTLTPSRHEPSPTPSVVPLMPVISSWQLDCPNCPVVLLDAEGPEVFWASSLQKETTVRIVGCTDLQTSLHRQFLFSSPDGEYTGVVLFGLRHPKPSGRLECFEMVGQYQGTKRFSLDTRALRRLDRSQANPILVSTTEAQRFLGPVWDDLGPLGEFSVTEWVALPPTADTATARAYLNSIPTPVPTMTPEPTPTVVPPPTATPRPTETPRPTSTPRPTNTPRPTPTPTLTPQQALVSAKNLMLDLINGERRAAGVPPVVLGNNRAAQIHADNSLSGCISSHWGLDGTKPYVRYALAGGYQSNGENVSGLDVCVNAGHGYAPYKSVDNELRKTMEAFMKSPGHRDNILDPIHRKLNLGIAWDHYNLHVVQQFEGDYVEFELRPAIKSGVLAFRGSLNNGARIVPGDLKRDLGVQIFFDPPLRELTRGQVSRSYSYSYNLQVASLRPPPQPGYHYTGDQFPQEFCRGPDPYGVSPEAWAPRTPEESNRLHKEMKALEVCRFVRVPWVSASRWKLTVDGFNVQANLRSVVDQHGPGIYTVVLWAMIDDESQVVSEYPIFHKTRPPDGYYP